MDAKKVEELRQSVEFKKFASYMVWNQAPDKALADMPAFLVHLMARCPEGACRYARDNFGLTDDDFREAFINSSPGEFIYESNWNKWCEILGFDPPIPYPRKYPDAVLF